MNKMRKDDFLDRLTPDDIENIILPTLKADKEAKNAELAKIVERKFSLKKGIVLCFLLFFLNLATP